jgi:hypothetical protein
VRGRSLPARPLAGPRFATVGAFGTYVVLKAPINAELAHSRSRSPVNRCRGSRPPTRAAPLTQFPHCPAARRRKRRADDNPTPYFSTKYAPLPWPLENQRLVTVFLRV